MIKKIKLDAKIDHMYVFFRFVKAFIEALVRLAAVHCTENEME